MGLAWAALAGASEALPSELVVASGPGCAGTREALGEGSCPGNGKTLEGGESLFQ